VKRIFLLSGLLVLFYLMPSCKSPTSPTPPATVQSITVTSNSDLLYIGISETFTATMTMSDGTSKPVTAGVWGGDTPSVATVEAATGRVTIVGSGMVTIFVDYQGRRGTKVIRGLPNYQGTWSGSYYIVSCSASGNLSGSCTSFPVNQVFPTNLNLIQDRDRVTGKFYLGTLSADATGPIQTDGQLLLVGKIVYDIWSIDVSWRMMSATPGKITGSLSEIFLAAGYSGDIRISANIRDLNRTSTMTTELAPGGPRLLNPTLEDLIRALVGR